MTTCTVIRCGRRSMRVMQAAGTILGGGRALWRRDCIERIG
ncbi:MAG: hypothetical protein ACYCYN_07120 [Solirubrobacteraceae bacterium]